MTPDNSPPDLAWFDQILTDPDCARLWDAIQDAGWIVTGDFTLDEAGKQALQLWVMRYHPARDTMEATLRFTRLVRTDELSLLPAMAAKMLAALVDHITCPTKPHNRS